MCSRGFIGSPAGRGPDRDRADDEAGDGMVGTCDYHQLLTAVSAAGGKLVAIGDRAQPTEIDAWRHVRPTLSRLQLRGELTDNHRQTNGWERDMLAALRRGGHRSRAARLHPARPAALPPTPPDCARRSPSSTPPRWITARQRFCGTISAVRHRSD